MQTRTAGWIAWSLMGLVVMLVLASLWLDVLNRHNPLPPGVPSIWSDVVGLPLFVMPYAAVGALIVSRRPGNRIGTIFLLGSRSSCCSCWSSASLCRSRFS